MNPKLVKSVSRLALSALFFAPASGFAQSILLTASDFTTLAGTSVTSTGTVGTVISGGDVGAQASITEFPPALVSGGVTLTGGPAVAQAVTDLITAATGLAGMGATSNLTGLNLGGRTLTPGVYRYDDAALFSGELILDAQGQNNVSWVFQIGSALTTAANASVLFANPGSNAGSDVGVFWNANQAITFGANNTLLGNYLAGTSITLGTTSSGGARVLAQAAVSFDNDQINAYGGPNGSDWTGGLTYGPGGSVVPIELSAVPEPSSYAALCAFGLVGLAMRRVLQRRRAAQPLA